MALFFRTGAIRVTERSRPPGLDQIAGDGFKLAGRLALGLASVPLIGLALLGSRKPVPEASAPRAASPEREPVPPVDPTPPPAANREGPDRAEIEVALKKLADATIQKAGRQKNGAGKPAAAARRRSNPAKAPAGKRTSRRVPAARRDDRPNGAT
jgi:hypothetical protein